MKSYIYTIIFFLCAIGVSAQELTDGYYRIQNVGSKRYLYLRDDKGRINVAAGTAEMGAIELWKGEDNCISDPSSVIYVRNVGEHAYRFEAQGTNSFQVIGYDLLMRKNRKDPYFKAYQRKSGLVTYLCDAERSSVPDGVLGTNDNGTNYRYWNMKPIKAEGKNFFAIKPTITAGGKYYAPFFAQFPYTFKSKGMKAYTISKVDKGMAVIQPLTEGVGEATPVIICSTSKATDDNKVYVGKKSVNETYENLLKGVYFCNNRSRLHRNLTAYEPATMRMLGVDEKGNLAFVTSDIKYIPANTTYLSVPVNTEKTLRIVTPEEYNEVINGIENVVLSDNADNCIYNLSGKVVGKSETELKHLSPGVYVYKGKKIILK